MPPILMWVLVVVAAAVCGALGYYFGGENRKRTAEAKIGSAEEEAKRIVNDAIKAAEQKRKETIIEAKDEAFKLKLTPTRKSRTAARRSAARNAAWTKRRKRWISAPPPWSARKRT